MRYDIPSLVKLERSFNFLSACYFSALGGSKLTPFRFTEKIKNGKCLIPIVSLCLFNLMQGKTETKRVTGNPRSQ
jgi:hypothetical protein